MSARPEPARIARAEPALLRPQSAVSKGSLPTQRVGAGIIATGRDDALPSILAVDPGTLVSGWVVLKGRRVAASGIDPNDDVLRRVADWQQALAIEMIASYGMPVGAEVFETCVWIGRYVQAYPYPRLAQLVYRRDVKLHLCGTSQAKDPHIRQALLDLIGPQGVKRAPGPTYGVKSHAWSALAVAVTALRLQREPGASELAL